MAKTISFSVLKILPTLLSSKKKQTIRPAWKIVKKQLPYDGEGYSEGQRDLESEEIISKPPRFKVREPVRLYWKQRRKDRWYCKKTGLPLHWLAKIDRRSHFNKILGESEITEVFKIVMGIHTAPIHKGNYYIKEEFRGNLQHMIGMEMEDLAKKDGFKSAEEMFKYFHEAHDLSEPKEFYVYRWK